MQVTAPEAGSWSLQYRFVVTGAGWPRGGALPPVTVISMQYCVGVHGGVQPGLAAGAAPASAAGAGAASGGGAGRSIDSPPPGGGAEDEPPEHATRTKMIHRGSRICSGFMVAHRRR